MYRKLFVIYLLFLSQLSFGQNTMSIIGEMPDYIGEKFLLLKGDDGGVFIVDSAVVKSNGFIEFKWEGSYGFYRISNKVDKIDVKISDNRFTFTLSGKINEGDLQFVQNDENYEYQYYLSEFKRLNGLILGLQEELKNLSERDSPFKNKYEDFKRFKKDKRNLLRDLWSTHIDSWSARFALAQQEIIPDVKLTEQKSNEYYLKHFFDYFAFSDSLLSGTPVYYEKISRYLKAQKIDQLIKNERYGEVKEVLGNLFWLTELDPNSQKYLANYLMSMYPESFNDKVYHIIADLYRILNTCEYVLNSKTIKRRINNFKSIGENWQLPDIPLYHSSDGRIQNLTNVNSEITLLLIWSGSCEHSVKLLSQISELYFLYKDLGFEVVAVSLDTNLNYWQSVVSNNNYSWINACDTDGLQGTVADQLNIFVTPSMFLIDSSLKTIAIPQTFFQLEKKLNDIFN